MKFDPRRITIELGRRHWNEKLILELTKLGDRLFDFLAEGLRNRRWKDRETANALFLLGNLVREACSSRKAEVLEFALDAAGDDRQEVRDSAVRVATSLGRLAQRFPIAGITRTRFEVRTRVRRALELGLGAEAMDCALKFLKDEASQGSDH